MRIRTQFIITMLLFGTILVVLAASAIITHQKLEKASQQENLASNISQGASELSYLSNDYLIYRESQQLKRWQSRFASFSNQVAGLNVDKPEQQVLVRNIKANEQRLKQVFESVASAVGNPSQNRSTALNLAFLQVSWSRMAVQSQGLVSDASRLSQLLHQQMDQLTATRTVLMYVMVGLFGAFLLASYMLTYRNILKSIVTLQAGAAVIGSGNLDFKIEEKQNDEIGDLSHAFNRMSTDLKAVTASKADLEREIDERKRAEEELRRSQTLLAEAERLSHTGAWEWDLTKDQWTFSDEWLAIHGCPKRLLTSEDLLPIAHPDDRTAIARAFEEVRNGVRPYDIEHRIIRQDTGEVRTIQAYGRLIRDVTDTPIKVLGVAQDITERKRAEEELRQQREWLRVTLSSIGDAVIASDTEGRITFLNPVAVTLTGWQLEETLGQPIQDVFRIINEKTHAPAEDLVARVLNEKRVVALANDTALVTKDGREVPIEDSAAPILDAAGNVTGVVLVFHDVTERRRAQTALRDAHERAVWLARFPEQNPNPIIRASADGTVLYCNPASAKLHGWTCEVGQLLKNELLPLVGRAMAEGREVQQDLELGGRFYFIWVAPFPGEGYANMYGRDITERKQAEEKMRQRTSELQYLTETLEHQVRERTAELAKANATLHDLSSRLLSAQEEERKRIAGDLHDSIGSSLSAIKFKVENVLLEIGKTPKAATESLSAIIPVIQEGIEECRRMQQDLRPSILDDLGLLPTLSWFSRRFQTIYSTIRIEQEIDIREDELPNALKIIIYRVLQEAMNNSAKHSGADLVHLSLRKVNGRMELTIRDNGQGFDLEKISSQQTTIKGLGLTSMRERVELCGGSFTIESAGKKGTIIRASWPLRESS